LSHDKGSIYVFNKALLDAVSKTISFKQVHYWSDGTSAQFKNRFNLASVLYHSLDFGTQATWSFFETAHGKGAVDGVGGAVKHAVWRAILQDCAVVNSAEEFARAAENECLTVKVLYIPKEDITQAKEQLLERWNACISIPETHSIHYVTKLSDTTVSVAKNSQFLKQDTCTEHVLLSSFSLKANVGDSAATKTTARKQQVNRVKNHKVAEIGSQPVKKTIKQAVRRVKIQAVRRFKIQTMRRVEIQAVRRVKIQAARRIKIQIVRRVKIQAGRRVKIQAVTRVEIQASTTVKIQSMKRVKIQAVRRFRNQTVIMKLR